MVKDISVADDTIETVVDYIIIAVTIVVATLIMIGVGNVLTNHLPIVV